ncbi:hypothetical protein D3C87_1739440 [compost metagenome]
MIHWSGPMAPTKAMMAPAIMAAPELTPLKSQKAMAATARKKALKASRAWMA